MSNDFDFLHGEWNVANRGLAKRLVGSDDWREFPGECTCHGFFDGAGSFDEIRFPTRGFSGSSYRMFNPATKEWAIYWVDSRGGELQPPVFGSFEDGIGTFYGNDEHEGTPVRVRYIWSKITPTSAQWEQAFSVLSPAPTALRAAGAAGPPPAHSGQTWETNWVMNFTRR